MVPPGGIAGRGHTLLKRSSIFRGTWRGPSLRSPKRPKMIRLYRDFGADPQDTSARRQPAARLTLRMKVNKWFQLLRRAFAALIPMPREGNSAFLAPKNTPLFGTGEGLHPSGMLAMLSLLPPDERGYLSSTIASGRSPPSACSKCQRPLGS